MMKKMVDVMVQSKISGYVLDGFLFAILIILPLKYFLENYGNMTTTRLSIGIVGMVLLLSFFVVKYLKVFFGVKK